MYRRTLAGQLYGVLTICLLATSAAHAQTLISHYTFDGNTDNSIAGQTDGVLVDFNPSNPASSLGPGIVGSGALELNFGDYLSLGTLGQPNGNLLHDVTIATWVRTAESLTDGELSNVTLLGELNDSDSTGLLFGTNGVGNLQLFPRAADGSQARPRLEPGGDVFALERSWADGEWHHLAFRWNGGAEQGSGEPELASVFLDGVNLGGAPTNHFLDSTDTQNEWQFPLAIGARNNRGTLDGFFDGALDDFRIYSDFLSDEEILGIFNELAPGDENADFDSDGDIDGQDFLAWQEGLGTGSELSDGDANSSGSVDGADLTIWESQFGTTPGAVQASAVPEASSLAILLSGLFSLAVRRR